MIQTTHKLVDTKDSYKREKSMVKEIISGGELFMKGNFQMIVFRVKVQLNWEKLFLKDILSLKETF
jgi:hypothetical protein